MTNQKFINHDCEQVARYALKIIRSKAPNKTERLYTCKAEVLYYDEFIALRSYNTIVAVYENNGYLFDILRLVYGYTATSAQHIAKFARYCNAEKILRWMM